MRYENLSISFTLSFIIIIIGLIHLSNQSIKDYSKEYISSDIHKIPCKQVGLLLGTSKVLMNGRTNPYFIERINATQRLFENGNIRCVIISGDNSKIEYNEPEDMKKELLKRGIPENAIYLDYAGFRTLDSVVRSNKVFGQKSIIVISQKFHNERAIFIARKHGIKAMGYNADQRSNKNNLLTQVRELLARVNAVLDIILKVQPKFLGSPVIIE